MSQVREKPLSKCSDYWQLVLRVRVREAVGVAGTMVSWRAQALAGGAAVQLKPGINGQDGKPQGVISFSLSRVIRNLDFYVKLPDV